MMRKRHFTEAAPGFTLLEVMIAIALFGFLMLGISQFMRQETRLMGTALKQNEISQKARTAMMQVLDAIHLQAYTFYSYSEGTRQDPPTGEASGVYYFDINPNVPGNPGRGDLKSLINVNPGRDGQGRIILKPGTAVYYDDQKKELRYGDNPDNANLIADQILTFTMVPETNRFVKIDVVAGDSGGETFELVSWARLY